MTPKISIIVPIYKVEDYLHRCVDSILHQTYTNLEIILVDDGSPDNCPKICDEYAEKDPRVRVVHKTNGGLSSARNAGLDTASGDFIMFADSDDYLPLDAVSLLLSAFNEDEKVGMTFGQIEVLSNGTAHLMCIPSLSDDGCTIHGKDFGKNVFSYRINIHTVNKMYRSCLIGDSRFRIGRNSEDHLFMMEIEKAMSSSELIVKGINDIVYHYCIRDGSIMTSKKTPPQVDSMLNFAEICEYYRVVNKECYDAVRKNYYVQLCNFVMDLDFNTEWRRLYKKHHLQILNSIPLKDLSIVSTAFARRCALLRYANYPYFCWRRFRKYIGK